MKVIKKKSKDISWFMFAVVLIAIYKILDNFSDVKEWLGNLLGILSPFLMAVLLAYLLFIPCRKVEKLYKKSKILRNKARGLSVLTVYFVVTLVVVCVINTLIPTLSSSFMDLAKSVPSYYNEAVSYVDKIPEDSPISRETIQNIIKKFEGIKIEEFFTLDHIALYIEKAVGFASGIFSIVVTFIVSIYILLERTDILNFLRKLSKAMFTKETYNRVDRYFVRGNTIFFKYVSSQVLDAIIVGIIMSVALSIMKVKYAILLGFAIGIFNLVPFFGAIIAVALAAIITVFTGGINQAIWVVVTLIILQQIDANIINPKIVGDALEISKILIIFSVTIFGAYFGILGMFLGVPIVAVIKMILDDYIDNNTEKDVLTNK